VFLALIGPRWLTIEDRRGKRRLQDPADLVRREIELALTLEVPVIPVLVDEASMPRRGQLPRSIAALATRQGYPLPWYQGVARLERRIEELERARAAREAAERAERARLDLTGGRYISPTRGGSKTASQSFNIVTRAMEMSLAHQGQRISLDPTDLAASLRAINPARTDEWFLFPDLVYTIDVAGVKAKRTARRFVARTYPLRGLEEIPTQLQLGRPVLAGLTVFESWNREPAMTTGMVDGEKSGNIITSVVGVILGWDPVKRYSRVLTPWPGWGDKGIATLSDKAAKQSLDPHTLRSIEVAPKPMPVSPIPTRRSRTSRAPG
jgi:hypothetical protein